MEGRVKRFMIDRGFGFVETQWGSSIFFHVSEITPALPRGTDIPIGTRLEFDEAEDGSGRAHAENIRLVVDVSAPYR
jgi:cold shock CspA family protein